ncbi:AMP-binding protein [Pseudorhodoferax soli]|uniref:Long-chain acyl-CoA synthetase n=1 Tax=Pseudorhodoferax soli TaxID=545864 RepID=A0A368XN47_9BURK|nr:AMP-binding protein [Pseudorhodoferax soli]RCW68596.1 long-chain acyl-CoA synthetase [Pseudorhodoferax soli]
MHSNHARDGATDEAASGGAPPRSSLPCWDTVHAPLAYWAAHKPDALAISDGAQRLDFAELARRVRADPRAAPTDGSSPLPAWVDDALAPGAQLMQFLAVLTAGNAAVVGDPDWSAQVRREVEERLAMTGVSALPHDAFYVGFTSGSTGLPKGFVRSHTSWTSSFEACIDAFGPAARTPLLAPGRLSHSLFLFGALLGIWSGAGVHLQQRFSASAALHTLASGAAQSLVAVPSQLILMLEQARRHGPLPIASTQLVMVSGAPWPRARTPQLRQLFPNARIVEFYGASETSFIAWTDSHAELPASAVGRPFANVELRIVPTHTDTGTESAESGAAQPGRIYVRSPMGFSDYVTPVPTQGPGALLRDGDWLSVGDMGHLDDQGLLHLAGRQQRMFVVQGKNLFPEEVESVLAEHPSVASVSVQAVGDAVRGLRTVAVLELEATVDRATLVDWCRARLEPYKTPRRFYVCAQWPRTASGKTDHGALARQLAGAADGRSAWRMLAWRQS